MRSWELGCGEMNSQGPNIRSRELILHTRLVPIMNTLAAILATLLTVIGAADAEVPLDPFAAATDFLKFSFEEVEDQDADRLPDDWIRRRGPEFPGYVKAALDETTAHAGRNSLRVRINGARLTYYSPITQAARVDPDFNYVFRGFVRTDRLKNDAALYSVSFLNHRKERLQQFVTRAVSGSHKDWVKLELGPLVPHPDARFVVMGCHIASGQEPDLTGNVWFDDISMGRLPRLKLTADVRDRYVAPGASIPISVEVSGVEVGVPFDLFMSLTDIKGKTLAERQERVQLTTERLQTPDRPTRFPFAWTIEPQEPGCYFVRTHLNRDGRLMLLGETTVAVLETATPRPQGEFGWSLPNGYGALAPRDVAFVASQAGIHWLKLPLWKAANGETAQSPNEINDVIDRMTDRAINVVGILGEPPSSVARRFGDGFVAASNVFGQPRDFWGPSLEPVLIRFSSSIDYWQLGADDDLGFIETPNLLNLFDRLRDEFGRTSKPPKLGVAWEWPQEVQPPSGAGRAFVSARMKTGIEDDQLARYLDSHKSQTTEHWLTLELPPSELSTEERASRLARQLIVARTHDASAVFAADVMQPERGLIRNDGSPGSLFLPWRTTTLALQGAKYIGSLRLPNKSTNHVFERNSEVTIVVSNELSVTERLNLGDNVEQQDLWGRRQKMPRVDGVHSVAVGPAPVFCMGCSAPLTKWNIAVGFENARVPSARGTHPNAILGRNTFNRSVNLEAKLKLPRGWDATPSTWTVNVPAGDAFRLPTNIQMPDDTSLGSIDAIIEFKLAADRQETVEVYRPLEVGLGDVVVDVRTRKLPDGRLEIEQIVLNNTRPEELLEFRCSLSVSGQKRQTRFVSDLSRGEDRQFYFLPNADALRGQALWLNLEQIGGKRNLNKRLIIGREWE